MRIRMWVLPTAIGLALAMGVPGAGATAPPPDPHGTTPHVVGDGTVDTPLEIDRARDQQKIGTKQHGEPDGHIPGSKKNVELIGKLNVSGAVGQDKPGHIADVAVHGNYAFLAARRLNAEPCGKGGFYTADISNLKKPVEKSFTEFPAGSYPGEGMQVVEVNTAKFQGRILVANNEICSDAPTAVGGMSIYDVTDPLKIKPLAIGKGDTNDGELEVARQIHSVFAWQQGAKAYAIIVDDEEVTDVDIMDITDPANPKQVAETGVLDWPDAHKPLANGESVFLHDMVVKRIRGHWYGLLSYWDVGWIILNLDNPVKPAFVDDSDYRDPEKLLGFSPPEGNAHQAEWSHDNKFIVGTDEDFSPRRTSFAVSDGDNAGTYGSGEFGWTKQIDSLPGKVFQGNTAWGGSGCEEDVDGDGTSDRAQVPSKSSTGADIIVFTRGVCFFSKKVESGQLAGYDKVIVIQSHTGSRNGLFPNGFSCGGQGHDFVITAAAICIGHRAGHLLFNDTPEYDSAPEGSDMPALGTVGASVKATTTFDGWGSVHLIDARTLKPVDNYAIKEALDPDFADDFGALSVHEVATDPDRNLGYLSYYAGGIRVIKFGRSGMKEVGHYADKDGNDFWGVEAAKVKGKTHIFGSDRDSGLWIFRYTGR